MSEGKEIKETVPTSVKEIAKAEKARITQTSVEDVDLPEETVVELSDDVLPVSDRETKYNPLTRERIKVQSSISKYYPIAKRFFDSNGYIRIKARGKAMYYAADVAYYLRKQFKLDGVVTTWNAVSPELTIDAFTDDDTDRTRYVFGIVITVSIADDLNVTGPSNEEQ